MRTVQLIVRWFCAAVVIAAAFGLIAGQQGASAQTSDSVTIADFSFSAATVTIEAGGSVTWTNSGAVPHSATGDAGEFDTGIISSGDSVTITFDTPGTYTYHCSLHSSMVATVVVTAADDGGDDDPVTELPDTGSGLGSSDGNLLAAGLGAMAIMLLLGSIEMRRKTR